MEKTNDAYGHENLIRYHNPKARKMQTHPIP